MLSGQNFIPTKSRCMPPRKWIDFCDRNPEWYYYVKKDSKITPLQMTRDAMKFFNRVNRAVNNEVVYRTDDKDFWDFPRYDAKLDKYIGDCEDNALEKWDDLLMDTNGKSPHISFCLCKRRTGRRWIGHAVLLIHADTGVYVMDNTFNIVYPWDHRMVRYWNRYIMHGRLTTPWSWYWINQPNDWP